LPCAWAAKYPRSSSDKKHQRILCVLLHVGRN
jgi:hypothetical protein